MTNIACTFFLPRKGLLIFLFSFFTCSALAAILVVIGRESPDLKRSSLYIITIASIVLFFPFLLTFVVKKKYLQNGFIVLTETGISVNKGAFPIFIQWSDIRSYIASTNTGTFYYVFEINKRSGDETRICIVDRNLVGLDNNINQKSFVALFCQYVHRYNMEKAGGESQIFLQENLYKRKIVNVLLLFILLLLMVEIGYRLLHPAASFGITVFTFLLFVVLIINVFVRRKSSLGFYNSLCKLHNGSDEEAVKHDL